MIALPDVTTLILIKPATKYLVNTVTKKIFLCMKN